MKVNEIIKEDTPRGVELTQETNVDRIDLAYRQKKLFYKGKPFEDVFDNNIEKNLKYMIDQFEVEPDEEWERLYGHIYPNGIHDDVDMRTQGHNVDYLVYSPKADAFGFVVSIEIDFDPGICYYAFSAKHESHDEDDFYIEDFYHTFDRAHPQKLRSEVKKYYQDAIVIYDALNRRQGHHEG